MTTPARGDGAGPGWVAELAAAIPRISAGQLTSFVAPEDAHPAPASVLMLFGEGAEGPETVFVERSTELRRHAGQVAFPGGRQDGADHDAVAAALREAEEETGLDPAGVDVLGALPALWLPVTDYLVTPVVGWWRTPSAVHAVDPAETSAVHVVSLAVLLDPANRGRVRHPSGYIGPGFLVSDVLVWGFTAGLLARFLALVGWERPWDRTRMIDLPPGALAGSQRDLRAGGSA